MEAVKVFVATLIAPLPTNWPQWCGLLFFLVLHFILTRSKSVRANNLIEAFANGALAIPGVGALIKATPVVGAVMQFLDTPPTTTPPPPPVPHAAVSIPLNGPKLIPWLVFIALGLSGCADVMYRYDQTTASLGVTAKACRDVLSKANASHLHDCAARLPDKVAAQTCVDVWQSQYANLHDFCADMKLVAESALTEREIVNASVNRDKDALGWIARLLKAAADTTEEFSKAGISFSVKGMP